MMSSDGFTRLVDAWLREEGAPTRPAYLDEVLTRTSATRQRPAWLSPGRWLPMDTTLSRRAPRVPSILLYAILAAILILGAVAALAIVGSQQPKLPPPFGLAANGPIAVEVDGALALFHSDGTRSDVETTRTLQASPIFSRDGTRIAYWAADDASYTELVVAKADGTDERVVARGFGLDIDPDPANLPAWSLDGSRVAFSSPGKGTEQVVVANADGSGATIIGEGSSPAWSTDGQWLAFGAFAAGGDRPTSLAVARHDGSERRILATATMPPDASSDVVEVLVVQDVAWAPDGSGRILYATGPDTGNRIAVVDVATGSETTLFERPGVLTFSPVWSPDGRRIAANWSVIGSIVMNADGSDVRELPEARCSGSIQWAPDGTRILCLDSVALSDGRSELLVVDPDGREPVQRIPLGGTTSLQSASAFGWQRLAP